MTFNLANKVIPLHSRIQSDLCELFLPQNCDLLHHSTRDKIIIIELNVNLLLLQTPNWSSIFSSNMWGMLKRNDVLKTAYRTHDAAKLQIIFTLH